jgi:hypothetical protein
MEVTTPNAFVLISIIFSVSKIYLRTKNIKSTLNYKVN